MKSDIVLIIVDCLRYDIVQKLFDDLTNKMHLNKNDEFLTFEQCLASGPYTWVSVPVIMTGLPAKLLDYPLFNDRSNLAKILKSQDYYTFAYITNPIVGVQGYSNDFNLVCHEYSSNSKIEARIGKHTGSKLFDPISRALIAILRYGMYKLRLFGSTWSDHIEILSKASQQFLKSKYFLKKPIFMYIHLMDLHFPAPYNVQTAVMSGIMRQRPSYYDKYVFKSIRYDYINTARSILLSIKRFINIIKRLTKEYLVIVTADHGEMLGELGLFGHDGIAIKFKETGVFKPIFAPQLFQTPLLIFSNYKTRINKIVNPLKASHYDLFWNIIKEGNYEYYKKNVSILSLYKQFKTHVIEADKYIVWGKGLYGEQYLFITEKGHIITDKHPDYRKLEQKWKIIKKILWYKKMRMEK